MDKNGHQESRRGTGYLLIEQVRRKLQRPRVGADVQKKGVTKRKSRQKKKDIILEGWN
jgi:hypothetical protein